MGRKIIYDPKRDYYTILGIDVAASPEEVRLAYRRAVREVHPDRHPEQADWATEQIQRLNEAYGVLSKGAARREYDRLRWPHVPTSPKARRPSAARNAFGVPRFDPERPWWEQAAAYRPPPYAFTDDPYRSPHSSAPAMERPFWLKVSGWLREHRLAALEPTWLTLVGLWRSPYAGLLTVLSVALALNVAIIIYAFIAPNKSQGLLEGMFGWLARDTETIAATPAPLRLTPTPDRLYRQCSGSGVQVLTPVDLDTVGDSLSVFGTVQHAEMWNFSIALGYLGLSLDLDPVPRNWATARMPPLNQTIPEPSIQNDLLDEQPIDLSGKTPGYYVIRVQVMLRDGSTLPPCDVVVRH
jgi:hypothetical protein